MRLGIILVLVFGLMMQCVVNLKHFLYVLYNPYIGISLTLNVQNIIKRLK